MVNVIATETEHQDLQSGRRPELRGVPSGGPRRACMVSYSVYESDNRVRRYAETLARSGYSVDAIALRRKGQPKQQTVNDIRLFGVQYRIKNERGKFSYLAKIILFFCRSMLRLAWQQIKEPYDIVHVHSVPDFEVFAAFVPKLMGAKVILDIHDIVPEFYASKFKVSSGSFAFRSLVLVEKISCWFADHVIVSNHIWEKRLRERSVPQSKLITILNFPDTKVFSRRGRSRHDGRIIMLYPGTLNFHQGLDIAIRAFSYIDQQIPEAEFHIYGSGDQLAVLQKLISDLHLEGRVLLRGSLPIDKMARVIEDADIGIVPKRNSGFGDEAFSTKILEFMALGVPVIVSATTIDRYYFNEQIVRFFGANDDHSLAESMMQLVKDRRESLALVHRADEFIKGYTWEVNKHLYMDVVKSL